MSDLEKIMAQLDQDRPRWFIEFAQTEDLSRFTLAVTPPSSPAVVENEKRRLKVRVAERLFLPIVNAAICAGVVKVD